MPASQACSVQRGLGTSVAISGFLIWVFSSHASEQAARRGIEEGVVLEVALNPQQTLQVSSDREIRQSRLLDLDRGHEVLIRVVVDRLGADDLIVTVYRTSKIQKYWMEP